MDPLWQFNYLDPRMWVLKKNISMLFWASKTNVKIDEYKKLFTSLRSKNLIISTYERY